MLSDDEFIQAGRLGLDSWAGTGCTGKHAYVDEFIVGSTVFASGFADSLGKLNDLPFANVLYAYDRLDGTTVLLEHNNVIYLGDNMEDSLATPIQCEENNVHVDLRPKRYCQDDTNCQCVTLDDGTTLPLEFYGVLPFIPIRRPTTEEVGSCERIPITSRDMWDPFLINANFCNTTSQNIDLDEFFMALQSSDPISAELSLPLAPLLENIVQVSVPDDEDNTTDAHVASISSKHQSSRTPADLNKSWNIGLADNILSYKRSSGRISPGWS